MSEIPELRAPLVTAELLRLATTLLEVPQRELQGWLAQNSTLRVLSAAEVSVDASVTLNEELEPVVTMTPLPELDRSALAKESSDENRQAQWVYRALIKRQESLAKLIAVLMQPLRRELNHAALTLPRRSTLDLASALEVHESTVRRLTLAKRIATPRGELAVEDLVQHEPKLSTTVLCSTTPSPAEPNSHLLLSRADDGRLYIATFNGPNPPRPGEILTLAETATPQALNQILAGAFSVTP
jgi:hypothetical protein